MMTCDSTPAPALGPRLLELARATGTLSPMAVRLVGGALAELAELDAKERAFWTVIDDVDLQGHLSRWALAQAIAGRLKRFKATAYRRILAGSRPCHDATESALAVLCEGCGSAGKIWETLRDLDLPKTR